MSKMEKKYRNSLIPLEDFFGEMQQNILTKLKGFSEEELKTVKEACAMVNETNCSWGCYYIAKEILPNCFKFLERENNH